MTANKRAVHSAVQLFIYFRWFVRSDSFSLIFADVRSMDCLIVNSVIRLSVRSLGSSFAGVSAGSFVCTSGFSRFCSIGPMHKREEQEEPGAGGGTRVQFCWVCAAGLSEPLPHYSLFCGQL